MNGSRRLRKLLKRKKMMVKPGAYDALSAMIIERTGFEVMGITGYGLSVSLLGKPDVGLTTLSEVVAVARNITGAVNIPVICDADTGFGNAINVMRTTEEFIKAGAAGFHIEDQVFPKRCGHVAGKQLISLEEAVGKLRAADRVRQELDPDFLLIARTDARGAVGGNIEEVIRRGKAYVEAGADMIFPDGLTSIEELQLCVSEIPAQIHYNMTNLGVSFYASLTELDEMGVAIVSNPGGLIRAAMKAMWDYCEGQAEKGTTYMIEADKSFSAHPTGNVHQFIGFPHIRELEEEFLPREEVQKKYDHSIGYQP